MRRRIDRSTRPTATDGRPRSSNADRPAASTGATQEEKLARTRVRRVSETPEEAAPARLRRVNAPAAQAPERRHPRPASADPAPVRVDNPARHLLVVSFLREAWPNAEAELTRLAAGLAGEDGAVVLCRIGHADRDARKAGADRLAVLDEPDTLGRRAQLLALCRRFEPQRIILADDPAGAELARFLAASLGVRPAIGVSQLRGDEILVPAADGRSEYHRPLAPVMTVRPVACRNLAPSRTGEARTIEPPAAEPAERRLTDDGLLDTDVSLLPIREAEFILGAGDGVRDFDGFRETARALSATIGASRVVCDAGLLPRHRQIGASGHIARAQCYIAMGISGAPQHLEGIRDCAHVIAVNTDPHAAMMQRADLAIIADAQQVIPALTAAARARHG